MQKAKLLPNLLWPIVAVVAANGVVFSLHWNSTPNNADGWLNPPGELVGAVWVALFLLMGAARYHLLKCRGTEAQRLARLVVWYMAFCLSYPFYTLGLSSYIMGLIGNAATFAFALYIVIKAWPHARAAAWCLSPVLPWIIYATLTILGGWR